jgi:hypothetical protein
VGTGKAERYRGGRNTGARYNECLSPVQREVEAGSQGRRGGARYRERLEGSKKEECTDRHSPAASRAQIGIPAVWPWTALSPRSSNSPVW